MLKSIQITQHNRAIHSNNHTISLLFSQPSLSFIEDIRSITIIVRMSKAPRNNPPHNYAKPVPELPPFRKEVAQTLSNELERLQLSNSSTSNHYKTYLIAHNNAYYRGPWVNGFPQGKGTCIFSDGSYYQGNFNDGQADDENGHLILTNGASYHGSIINSVIEGQGEIRQNIGNQNSYIYKGSWKGGKPNGYGEEKYGDGSEYKGYFKDGLKNCFTEKSIQQKEEEFRRNRELTLQGEYTSASGEIYRGEFLNGRMHGFGDYSKPDSSIRYTGQFYNGKKRGEGSLHTSSGVLSGYFDNDVLNGKGRFEWSKEDGRVYVGYFKDSKFHGEGKIILPNGNVLEGIWEDGHSQELKAVKTNRS